MKVILLRDVAKIGRRGEIADVPDGYARNQLIPKGMAEAATAANQKKVKQMQAVKDATAEADKESFSAAVEALRANTLKIAADVNEQGHAFKAVHEADIVSVAKEAGISIDEKMLSISEPIKSVGEHEIELVSADTKAKFTIEVVKK